MIPILAGVIKIAHYAVDLKEYKAQCINREVKEISCNGLCKLSSELASESKESENQNPIIPTIENLLPVFLNLREAQASIISFAFVLGKSNNYSYKDPVSQKFINELIKPPTAV